MLLFLVPAIAARADYLPLPPDGDALVGRTRIVAAAHEDTLADIARRFNVGHQEIRLANPEVDFWLPGESTRVTLPTRYVLPRARREGIVLNLPEMRMYFFTAAAPHGAARVITHPVSIGRMDWSTPLGRTRVSGKVKNPSWTPPQSVREEARIRGETLPGIIPPGPDNPLGDFAIRLDLPGYLIHGTNRPYGVGMRITHGCVRMYPEDIEALVPLVTVGTPVEFVDQPVKLGWDAGILYIEVHPALEESGDGPRALKRMAFDLLDEFASRRSLDLLQGEVLRALAELSGMPVAVSAPATDLSRGE